MRRLGDFLASLPPKTVDHIMALVVVAAAAAGLIAFWAALT